MKIDRSVRDFVNLTLKTGLRVFVAEQGHYGFVTNTEGTRVMSFAMTGLRFSISGNYRAIGRNPSKVGTGWCISDEWVETKGRLKHLFDLSQYPPSWATLGQTVKLTTLVEHLERYQRSSRYTEIHEPILVND